MSDTVDLAAIAQRHGFTEGAAQAALDALRHGHGRMAQFSHPEFGGMGQWSPGMTMIGAMFDSGLKGRVEALFAELARGADSRAEAPSHPSEPETGEARSRDWWPADLGHASSTGSQNDMRYALFPDKRRLAVRDGGRVTIYNTGEHRISGFGQQQGGTQTLSLSGGSGSISLDDLERVDSDAAEEDRKPAQAPSRPQEQQAPRDASPATSSPGTSSSARDDALGTLERLADLHRRGVVSDSEFAAKKADLLSRI